MDPLSITAGTASILSTVVAVSLKISQFIGDVRDASADMVLVTRELDSLTGALTQLSNNNHLAARLEAQSGLKEILSSCDKVLARMSTLMEKTASGRMSSVRWAMSGRADMGQLRTHLEAYKSALVIVLNVHTASLTGQISRDVRFIPEMHQQITMLCSRLPEETFAIQRFLEDTASYADSAYAGSVIDHEDTREPPVFYGLAPVQEDKESPAQSEMQDAGFDRWSDPTPTLLPPRVSVRSLPLPEKDKALLFEQRETARRKREKLGIIARRKLDKELYRICERAQSATEDEVLALLRKGAGPNWSGRSPFPDHGFSTTYGTALKAAVFLAPIGTVQTLLDWGADVRATGGLCEHVIVEAAFGYGRPSRSINDGVEIIRMLWERGADINAIAMRGRSYGSALHVAARRSRGAIEIVRYLLECGANVNSNAGKLGTPLHAAAECGNLEAAQLLVAQGADVNFLSRKNITPLEAAFHHFTFGEIKADRESLNPVIGFLRSQGAKRYL